MRLFSLIFLSLVSLSAAEGCTALRLNPDAQLDGILAAADCKLKDTLAGSPASRAENAAHVYNLDITRNSVLRIRMTSADVDSVLYLLSASGARIASDENGAGGRDAEMQIQLNPGSYKVIATTAAAATGAYRLTSASSDLRTCVIDTLEPGLEIERDLIDTDCRNADVRPMVKAPGLADYYRLRIPRRTVLVINMSSSAFETLVSLADDRGRAMISNKTLLTVSLEPGTYQIIASNTAGTGSYRLKAELTEPRVCEPPAMNAGETVRGQLADTDCRVLDVIVPSADAAYVDAYKVEIREPAFARIAMRAPGLDTMLVLFDADNEEVAFNDDSGETTDSEILTSLKPGIYTLFATSYEVSTGAYELTWTTDKLRDCPTRTLEPDGSITGVLRSGGCRYLDTVIPSSIAEPADFYKVRVPRRGMLKLATSGSFPALLAISNAEGEFLHAEFGEPNAEIDILLTPGEYTVMVAPGEEAMGEYTLQSSLRDARTCEAVELTIGGSVDGNLTESDCNIGDIVPGFVDKSTYIDLLRVEMPSSGAVTFQISSDAFLPVGVLFNREFEPVAAAPNLASNSITFTVSGRSGPHYLLVTNVEGKTGSYRVQSSTATTITR